MVAGVEANVAALVAAAGASRRPVPANPAPSGAAAGVVPRERWLLMRLLAIGQSTPRLADRLLEEHGSLGAVLAASEERLRRLGTDSNGLAILGLVRESLRAVLERHELDPHPVATGRDLAERFYGEMAWLPVEQVRVAYLDAGRRMQRIELQSQGTPRKSHLHPREITRRALELCSSAVVLVHNHPSGDPTPSVDDISITRKAQMALELIEVDLLDHLIVARSGVVSFAESGLI